MIGLKRLVTMVALLAIAACGPFADLPFGEPITPVGIAIDSRGVSILPRFCTSNPIVQMMVAKAERGEIGGGDLEPLWQISRESTADDPQSVLVGSVPNGFSEQIALDGPLDESAAYVVRVYYGSVSDGVVHQTSFEFDDLHTGLVFYGQDLQPMADFEVASAC